MPMVTLESVTKTITTVIPIIFSKFPLFLFILKIYTTEYSNTIQEQIIRIMGQTPSYQILYSCVFRKEEAEGGYPSTSVVIYILFNDMIHLLLVLGAVNLMLDYRQRSHEVLV